MAQKGEKSSSFQKFLDSKDTGNAKTQPHVDARAKLMT